MTRVTGPLFGTAAVGRIDDIGSFRMGRHGPEFIQQAKGSGGNTDAQQRLRTCFAEAKAAHSAITPTSYWDGDRTRYHRIPDWPTFWAQWLIDHPDCL